jgi:DNA-binding SARP family transcriptional activator
MSRLVPSNKQAVIYVLDAAQSESTASRKPCELAGSFKMSLFGSFYLEGPNGENLTPRGQKARALLALVALAKRGQRSRTWLCSKLWSDRPAEQAYASLRQCLTEIRKALGPYSASIFVTDQFNVSIDLNQISVDAVELRAALLEKREVRRLDLLEDEFLEGLNVGDEEFEEWLMIERSRWADIKDELEQTQATARTAWLTTAQEAPRLALVRH